MEAVEVGEGEGGEVERGAGSEEGRTLCMMQRRWGGRVGGEEERVRVGGRSSLDEEDWRERRRRKGERRKV